MHHTIRITSLLLLATAYGLAGSATHAREPGTLVAPVAPVMNRTAPGGDTTLDRESGDRGDIAGGGVDREALYEENPGGTPDSTAVVDGDTLRFVPAAEFTYGGSRRYTLYGELPLAETRIDPPRAGIVGGACLGVWVALHLNMSAAWWDERSSFHFKNDWDNVLQIDKAGHAFSGYMMSYGVAEGMMGAGMSWRSAAIAGSALGLFYQTYIELEDGFSESWGFSPSDMAANTVGAGFHLAQHFIPALQNFTPKYQYVPPSWIDAPRLSTTWIDDYNSSTFWLAVNVRNLLPETARPVWPAWLGLAVGYGVDITETARARRCIIALDYDLTQILPDGGHLWNWFRQTLNFIKLPAPALELAPTPKLRLLFPFRIGKNF